MIIHDADSCKGADLVHEFSVIIIKDVTSTIKLILDTVGEDAQEETEQEASLSIVTIKLKKNCKPSSLVYGGGYALKITRSRRN